MTQLQRECPTCGCDDGTHNCDCGQEITAKQCTENGGLCSGCVWITARM